MTTARQLTLLAFVILLFIGGALAQMDAPAAAAQPVITRTMIARAWQYLPVVHGRLVGPTVTATLPPPTMTPWITPTMTATASDTAVPPSNTPKPPPAAPTD